MSDLESDALKLSMAIDRAYIDALEAYFYECVEVPWVLMQKTSSDPYELIGYFKDEPSIQKAIQDLQTAIPDFEPTFESQRLPKTEWQNAYKAFVKPWNDRELHWIPLWARDSNPLPPEAVPVYIDAGMAFGTGCHETTQLCASRLVDFYHAQCQLGLDAADSQIVDAGCGSGILALSARALGYSRVRAFDNDPDALTVCEENLSQNPSLAPIEFSVNDLSSGLTEHSVDFLMANIQADILIPNAELLLRSLQAKPGTQLILSGILGRELESLKIEFQGCLAKLYPRGEFDLDSRAKSEWSDLKIEIIACDCENSP